MIKIKDYIINDNEIVYMYQDYRDIRLYLEKDYNDRPKFMCIENATFEDIEFNYEDEQIRKCLESIDREEELEDKIKELEEENKKLKEELHKASLDIQELTEKDIGCPSWCDKLKELEEDNKKLKAEVDLLNDNRHFLNNKINKAIEYIEENATYSNDIKQCVDDLRYDNCDELLKILKGEIQK